MLTGWRRGMSIIRRDPSSGQESAMRCVTSGSSCQTAWAGNTAYTLGTRRFNGANVYAVTVPGTSAASGGPTGTDSTIVDGGVTWQYIAPLAVWVIEGQLGIPRLAATQYSAIGSGPNTSAKFAGKLSWDTTNNRLLMAQGSLASDAWIVVDGSATVTPA